MDINKFKSIFKNGILRSNRYKLSIASIGNLHAPQQVLYGIASVNNETVETMVAKSELYGVPYKGVGNVKPDGTLQVTFLVDADGLVLDFFHKWQDKQYNKNTHQISYKERYVSSSVLIQVLGKKDDRVILTNEYRNVFPTKISGTIYGNEMDNIVPMITVTFEFDNVMTYRGDMSSSTQSFSSFSDKNDEGNDYTPPISSRHIGINPLGNGLEEELAMVSRWGVNDNIVDRISITNDILGNKDLV